MQNIDEKQAMAQVSEHLAARFPDLPVTTVERAVEQEFRKLDGRPVRSYVPVLVERSAREVLAKLAHAAAPVLTSH